MWSKTKFDLIFYGFVAILFGAIGYCTKFTSSIFWEGIEKNRAVVIGITTHCYTSAKIRGYSLNYTFTYKGKQYSSRIHLDKKPAICKGEKYLVELDSTRPGRNYLMVDSMVSN